jgi:hypothetical protein
MQEPKHLIGNANHESKKKYEITRKKLLTEDEGLHED